MSHLKSILSSIGGDGQSPAPSAVPKPPSRTASPQTLSNGSSAIRPASSSAPSLKRKADSEPSSNGEDMGGSARPNDRNVRAPAGVGVSSKLGAKPTSASAPRTSTSRPGSSGQASVKPQAKPAPAGPGTAKAPATPAAVGTGPKKGSFAEIMARAAAAQRTGASKPSVGSIQHKATERLSFKEKKARQAREADERRRQRPRPKGARPGSRPLSRSQSPMKSGVLNGRVQKQKKAPVDLGYRGTMRPSAPAQPVYKGTIGDSSKGRGNEPPRGYSEFSEDDEEGYDDSEDLSDMEAGMDEVDEEEEFSLRQARKEDLHAKREEERLKREKEQRKAMHER